MLIEPTSTSDHWHEPPNHPQAHRHRDRHRGARRAGSHRVYAAALTKAQREKLTPDDILAMMKRATSGSASGRNRPRLPRAAKGERQGPVSRRGHPELHRFPCTRRDNPGPGHRRLFQRAGGRQHRQRGHPREHGVRLQARGSEGRARDGAYRVRRHQGCDRQRAARKSHGAAREDSSLVQATQYQAERSAKNYGFVDAVARKNVEFTMADIHHRSAILATWKRSAAVKIVGAMYNLETGLPDFLG